MSAGAEVCTSIVPGELPPTAAAVRALTADGGSGAELVFHGRVRQTEHGRPIVALDYEQYDGMAAAELAALAHETVERFPVRGLECVHRVGRVAVGEPSLRVTLVAAHRAEALEALAWFVAAMKQRVPIWKWGVSADGERLPS